MSYRTKKILANKANYGSKRSTSNIKYIVFHYTGNKGDTAENNGNYFKNNIVKASANFFVDSTTIVESVPVDYVPYAVGGNKYYNCSNSGGGKFYKKATNANTINIEMCGDKNGKASDKTRENALGLGKELMEKYGIPIENVIRHFDVTGKQCPAYFCYSAQNDKAWKEFKDRLGVKESITSKRSGKLPYLVKITARVLNVRDGAGTDYKINTTVKKNEVYTITKENDSWGKLKSGAGWIHLDYVKKI